jgi:glycosyltransferase involved in cell wall biosynthesis
MKIVVFFEYSTINGGENSMLAAIDQIRTDESNQLQLIAATTSRDGPLLDRLKAANVPVTPFYLHDDNGDRLERESVIGQLRAIADTLNADVLHGNSLSMARLLGAANRYVPCPTVCHIRDIMKLSKSAASDVNKNDRLVAVSEATRDFHVQNNGIELDRIKVIHNGINVCNDIDKQDVRRRIRDELGIPENAIVALTVGQICLRKGLDTLAQAAVQASKSTASIHFILAGERYSAKQESIDFEQSVVDTFRSAPDSLTFHAIGFRSDVVDLMRAADFLIHAARQEPLGRVLLEAAATGLPTIATNVGGTPEIITHEESGLLVAADDVDAMSASILRLAHEPGLRSELAKQANQKIRQQFRIDSSAKSLVETWSECARTSND